MIEPIPDYKNLDLSGEAQQAAARMEARAQEPASRELFQRLIAPLLTPNIKAVFEFGCGTAALSRKIAHFAPQATIYASDKSEGMLTVAQHMIASEKLDNIQVESWDVLDESSFPFPTTQFDLIISSVVVPYLEDGQIIHLIERFVPRLSPGGILAFVEQDLATDAIHFPNHNLFQRTLGKELRKMKPTLALGLRPCLREAGLQVLPRRSFLWTDDVYGAYTRDLLQRMAEAACDKGQITPLEKEEWNNTLDALAQSGDFYYGLVYHLVAGKKTS